MNTVAIPVAYHDETDDFIKDAIRSLFEYKPVMKINAAIELYKEGKVSLGKAAEIAGMNTIQFKEVLGNRGIIREIGSGSVKELEDNVSQLEKLIK
ncbi:MAG: putative antitoxin, contains HTH domain [Candidatus Methanocomedens sp.]|nr:MAG: putative antitoxin, contains HTH domain [ANME-2 cluster archaeon]